MYHLLQHVPGSSFARPHNFFWPKVTDVSAIAKTHLLHEAGVHCYPCWRRAPIYEEDCNGPSGHNFAPNLFACWYALQRGLGLDVEIKQVTLGTVLPQDTTLDAKWILIYGDHFHVFVNIEVGSHHGLEIRS